MNFEHTAYPHLWNLITEVGQSPPLDVSDIPPPPRGCGPTESLAISLPFLTVTTTAILGSYECEFCSRDRCLAVRQRLLGASLTPVHAELEGTTTKSGLFSSFSLISTISLRKRQSSRSGPLWDRGIIRVVFKGRIHTRGVCGCMAARSALRNLNWPMQ